MARQRLPDIVINNFPRGISESPFIDGFADMRLLDIHSIPGVVQINHQASKKSASLVTGPVHWIRGNPADTTMYFAFSNQNEIIKSTDSGASWSAFSGNTTSGGTGNGLVIWKGYLLAIRNQSIDISAVGSASFSNSWKSLDNSTTWHMAIVGQDDVVYIADGRYIVSLLENSGSTFDPATAGTFTYATKALSIPANETIISIEELGQNLMIGTDKGNIYPWDRVSPSFGLPLSVGDKPIKQMKTINNRLWIVAGSENSVYVSNGSSIEEVKPLTHIDTSSSQLSFNSYPGAIMEHRGRLWFAVSNGSPGQNGMYSLQGNVLVFENLLSTQYATNGANTLIGALCSIDSNAYLIGYEDGATAPTTRGVDLVKRTSTSTFRYTSYAAYFDTDLKRVGTPFRKRKFTQVEIILDRNLATGQGVKVQYRDKNSGSFTDVVTFDFATYGAVDTLTYPFSGDAVESIQLRVLLTTGASSDTTPFLREVRLR